MDLVNARCAGLDVHQKTVVGSVRVPGPERGERRGEIKTFGTTMAGLLALADWLTAHAVTHVAMESTGVYWRPVYAVLEGLIAFYSKRPAAEPNLSQPVQGVERRVVAPAERTFQRGAARALCANDSETLASPGITVVEGDAGGADPLRPVSVE